MSTIAADCGYNIIISTRVKCYTFVLRNSAAIKIILDRGVNDTAMSLIIVAPSQSREEGNPVAVAREPCQL
jgi:hypothetical protein